MRFYLNTSSRLQPVILILGPGDALHIGRGRYHAFRKMTDNTLPESDCHHNLRQRKLNELRQLHGHNMPIDVCFSIAWDWLYPGHDAELTKKWFKHMMDIIKSRRKENMSYNCLLETSVRYCANALWRKTAEQLTTREMTMLNGILPVLRNLYDRSKKAYTKAKKDPRLDIDWEISHVIDVDRCSVCQYELFNHHIRRRCFEGDDESEYNANALAYCLWCYNQWEFMHVKKCDEKKESSDNKLFVLCHSSVSLSDEKKILDQIKRMINGK